MPILSGKNHLIAMMRHAHLVLLKQWRKHTNSPAISLSSRRIKVQQWDEKKNVKNRRLFNPLERLRNKSWFDRDEIQNSTGGRWKKVNISIHIFGGLPIKLRRYLDRSSVCCCFDFARWFFFSHKFASLFSRLMLNIYKDDTDSMNGEKKVEIF